MLRHVDVNDVLYRDERGFSIKLFVMSGAANSTIIFRQFLESARLLLEIKTYLVFAKEGQMEDDFKWLSVGGEHDQVGKASVEGLGRLIGSLLQLYHLTNRDVSKYVRKVNKTTLPDCCHQ